jgi:hypothetical protein
VCCARFKHTAGLAADPQHNESLMYCGVVSCMALEHMMLPWPLVVKARCCGDTGRRLDRNMLVSVPRELGQLSELQELYLDHNQVRSWFVLSYQFGLLDYVAVRPPCETAALLHASP